MTNILLWLPILLPMLAGVLLIVRPGLRPGRTSCCLSLLTAAATAAAFLHGGVQRIDITGEFWLILTADRLGFFFAAVICGAFLCAMVYATEYFRGDGRRRLFFAFCLLTQGAMIGLCLSGNLLTFYLFYELMSLASFPMVLYDGTEEARAAAMKYFGFSVFGAALVLMGMMLSGSLAAARFGDLAKELSVRSIWAFLLIAVGFSCKAGMMPLSNWLPTAHPVAPAPASALLSGVITKAGVLGIVRAAYFVFNPALVSGTFAQTVLLWLSVATVFTGSMLAYKEKGLKKRLAYSSVSQLSYVIFGLALMTPEGLSAALLQVLFHACAKVGLFLCAGSYIHYAEATTVDQLLGVGRRMPKVTAAFTVFALSLIGLPPFGGFVSKWQLCTAAFAQGSVPAQMGVIVLMISALLTAGYLLPIVSRGWFPGHGFTCEVCDGGKAMTLPLLALCAVIVLLGLLPGLLPAAL